MTQENYSENTLKIKSRRVQMQIRTIMSYHLTIVRMTSISNKCL